MITLGVWAAANVGVGLAGDFGASGDGPRRFFFQMSWAWGLVNGAIAGFGIADAFSEAPSKLGYLESVDQARATELAYLVNGALDLSYMAVGAWLWERGLRARDARLEGYGQALVLQGAFLLAFDGAMFGLSRTVSEDLEALPVKLVPMGTGAAVVGRF
jgi:hypothetical protein